MMRAVISAPPPGGNPTIRRTGRDGYACALADPDTIGSAAAPAARCKSWRRGSFIGVLLLDRLYCRRVNGRGRAMRAWIDRTNDGLSGMPADGHQPAAKKGGTSARPSGP